MIAVLAFVFGAAVWVTQEAFSRGDNMGLWNKLFGGAEGCREAMRESYEKHSRLAPQGRMATEDSPHACGLYGALGSRYILGRKLPSEAMLWAELTPFLAMTEEVAVQALAEYVIYQEYAPGHANVEWLREAINSALRSCADDQWIIVASLGVVNQPAWWDLLESDTLQMIDRAMTELTGLGEAEFRRVMTQLMTGLGEAEFEKLLYWYGRNDT